MHSDYISTQRRIDAILKLIKDGASDELLLTRLKFLMKGFVNVGMTLSAGQTLYRAVTYAEKPTEKNLLTYPPPSIAQLNRANREYESTFYCSIAREAVIFECRAKEGQSITISHWENNEKIFLNSLGYSKSIFDKKGSDREMPKWVYKNPLNTKTNTLIREFLADLFCSEDESSYNLSSLIAKKFIGTSHGASAPIKQKIDGLIYPSLAMSANADNLAICPNTVDKCLKLKKAEFIRIDRVIDRLKYEITITDFADSFSEEGSIQWQGRHPTWKVAHGSTAVFSVENGRWVVRDLNGKLIEAD